MCLACGKRPTLSSYSLLHRCGVGLISSSCALKRFSSLGSLRRGKAQARIPALGLSPLAVAILVSAEALAACIGVAAAWHYTLAAGCLTTGTDRCPVYHERTWLHCCGVTLSTGPLCLESILYIWAAVVGDGPGQDPRSWAVPHLLRFWATAVALPLALVLPLHGAAPAAGYLLTGM